MKTKRKFNILSILLLIAFFASFILDFSQNFDYASLAMSDAKEEAYNTYNSQNGSPAYYHDFFTIRPNHRYDIAARNLKTGKIDSLQVVAVHAKVTGTKEIHDRETTNNNIAMLIVLPFLFCSVYFLGTFIRLVWSVNKGEGFTKKTTYRLKALGWVCLALFGMEIIAWLATNYKNGLVDYAQYPISDTYGMFPDLLLLILFLAFLLFAQFFELGQKMKEEQDLTI